MTSGRLELAPRPASFGGSPFWNADFEPPTLRAIDAKAQARNYFRRQGIDLAARQADTLLLPGLPDGAAWSVAGDPPVAQLISYSVTTDTVHLVVRSDRPGFIRLAQPLSAFTIVTEGGVAVAPAADIASLIVIPLRWGINDIVVTAAPSRLRTVCFWISALTCAGLLIASRPAIRHRSSRPH